jgi:hypothetical protein
LKRLKWIVVEGPARFADQLACGSYTKLLLSGALLDNSNGSGGHRKSKEHRQHGGGSPASASVLADAAVEKVASVGAEFNLLGGQDAPSPGLEV